MKLSSENENFVCGGMVFWGKESIHRRAELFFAEKNGGHRGKISVVDMVFLVFVGILYPPQTWKVFL